MRPCKDKVLIEPIVEEFKESSGLYVKQKQNKGRVRSVGTGYRTPTGEIIKLSVKPGDVVLYDDRPWAELHIDGETLQVVPDSRIIAVFEEA